jgi:hypothetical protein
LPVAAKRSASFPVHHIPAGRRAALRSEGVFARPDGASRAGSRHQVSIGAPL